MSFRSSIDIIKKYYFSLFKYIDFWGTEVEVLSWQSWIFLCSVYNNYYNIYINRSDYDQNYVVTTTKQLTITKYCYYYSILYIISTGDSQRKYVSIMESDPIANFTCFLMCDVRNCWYYCHKLKESLHMKNSTSSFSQPPNLLHLYLHYFSIERNQ